MDLKTKQFDVIIVGAGAAGLMCAIEAGRRGRRVLVLEHNAKVGRKIRISGGGRCNFTNVNAGAGQLLSANPHFAKSALSRYTPENFLALVAKHKIPWHEKKLGQLFCDHSAQDIIDMLLAECRACRVEILMETTVTSVKKNEVFVLETNRSKFACSSLVIATGGLSIPSLGATDFGYRMARQFGLKIVEPRPGLVPLTFSGRELKMCRELSGLSLEVSIRLNGITFEENLLFTHKGLSGPAVLQISSYWKRGDEIVINLFPRRDPAALLAERASAKIELKTVLSEFLPKRFVELFCVHDLENRPMNRYSSAELKKIAAQLQTWMLRPTGTEGFAKAEVTVGGVDPAELSSKTMETRQVKGLYFIGEVVDVTGHLGGYNFQWAWASGFAAGQYV